MATFILSSVKSCEGGHGLRRHLLKKKGVWPSSSKKEKEYNHGHLPPFLNEELLRWSWHIF